MLASGEMCIALGWNGAKRISRIRQDSTSKYHQVEYVIPREGAPVYFDTAAIPADAPHPGNAHAFLNFLMLPETIAGVTNTVGYANANPSALPFVDDELRDDPATYPPADVRARLHPSRSHSQAYTRELSRAWTRFRTGQ
jgi:putrescine transport system substrate-binding protein